MLAKQYLSDSAKMLLKNGGTVLFSHHGENVILKVQSGDTSFKIIGYNVSGDYYFMNSVSGTIDNPNTELGSTWYHTSKDNTYKFTFEEIDEIIDNLNNTIMATKKVVKKVVAAKEEAVVNNASAKPVAKKAATKKVEAKPVEVKVNGRTVNPTTKTRKASDGKVFSITVLGMVGKDGLPVFYLEGQKTVTFEKKTTAVNEARKQLNEQKAAYEAKLASK